ncbi:MAG: hypothetical protein LBD37_08175 [Treponema sp.]|jgi:hypothetical protein|nr:hypothetical protein [Treponema sp.]
MKKFNRRIFMGAVLGLALLGFAGFRGCFTNWQAKREAAKEQELRFLKKVALPLRFKLLERDKGMLRVETRFYALTADDIDKDGMEALFSSQTPIAVQEFLLEGEELFIDFLKYEEPQGVFAHRVYWVFPYRLFTDRIAPDKGAVIAGLYGQDGFPGIYRDFKLSGDAQRNLARYYQEAQTYGGLDNGALKKIITGNAIHDMQNTARFKAGRWYDAAVHIQTGSVEFIAE